MPTLGLKATVYVDNEVKFGQLVGTKWVNIKEIKADVKKRYPVGEVNVELVKKNPKPGLMELELSADDEPALFMLEQLLRQWMSWAKTLKKTGASGTYREKRDEMYRKAKCARARQAGVKRTKPIPPRPASSVTPAEPAEPPKKYEPPHKRRPNARPSGRRPPRRKGLVPMVSPRSPRRGNRQESTKEDALGVSNAPCQPRTAHRAPCNATTQLPVPDPRPRSSSNVTDISNDGTVSTMSVTTDFDLGDASSISCGHRRRHSSTNVSCRASDTMSDTSQASKMSWADMAFDDPIDLSDLPTSGNSPTIDPDTDAPKRSAKRTFTPLPVSPPSSGTRLQPDRSKQRRSWKPKRMQGTNNRIDAAPRTSNWDGPERSKSANRADRRAPLEDKVASKSKDNAPKSRRSSVGSATSGVSTISSLSSAHKAFNITPQCGTAPKTITMKQANDVAAAHNNWSAYAASRSRSSQSSQMAWVSNDVPTVGQPQTSLNLSYPIGVDAPPTGARWNAPEPMKDAMHPLPPPKKHVETQPAPQQNTQDGANGNQPTTQNAHHDKNSDEEKLPDGWEKHTHDATGEIYYWHAQTGTSQWTHPGEPQRATKPTVLNTAQTTPASHGPGPGQAQPAWSVQTAPPPMYNQAQPTAMYYNQYTQEVTQGQAPMPQPTMPGVHPNYQPNQFTGQQQHVYQQQNYMQVQYMQYQQQWQGQWQQVQWTQGQPGQTQPNNYYQQPQQFNQQQMGQVTPMYQSCTLDQVLNLMGFAHLGRHERLSIDKFVTAHVDMPGQPHVAYVMHEKWNATRQQSERVRVYEPSAIPLVQKLVTQELLQKGLVQPMTMQPMPQQMQPKWPPTQQSAQCAIGPSQGAIGPNHTTGQQTTPKTAFAQQNGLDRHAKPFNPVNGPDLSLLGTTPTNEPATDAAADFGDPSSMTALDEALPAIVESPERNGLTRETSMSDPRDHPLASELRDRGSTPFTEDLDSAVTMADEDASTPMSAPLMPPNPTTKEAR